MKFAQPAILVVALAVTSFGHAQVISTRAELNSILTSSTTDDFEAFDVAAGDANGLDVNVLNSTTSTNGQGPGLVNPGATYSGDLLQWNGQGYVGMVTKAILADLDSPLKVEYDTPAQAVGFDIQAYAGYGFDGFMNVYNGASLVDTVNFSLSGTAGEVFFAGYRNDAGITSVELTDSNPSHNWSPIIDNHTYGAVPEPATMVVLGLGALAAFKRRKK